MRPEVAHLLQLGPLPEERSASVERIAEYEMLIRALERPLSAQEARGLVTLFGDDGCFGLALALVRLIESAPGWPYEDCLESDNEWVQELKARAIRGLRLPRPHA